MNSWAIFIIVKFDSIERMENLSVVIRYIKKNLSANVYIYEIGEAQNPFFSKYIADSCYYRFIEDFDPIFHRTYYINQAVNEIRDSIVAIWDADVIVPFSQIKDAFTMVSNSVDFCYPYKIFFLILLVNLDVCF